LAFANTVRKPKVCEPRLAFANTFSNPTGLENEIATPSAEQKARNDRGEDCHARLRQARNKKENFF
jgi:hypothetical protein